MKIKNGELKNILDETLKALKESDISNEEIEIINNIIDNYIILDFNWENVKMISKGAINNENNSSKLQ